MSERSSGTGPITQSPPEFGVPKPPQTIGRYKVEKILGQGGFGVVYQARDEQLQRFVAIKVPYRTIVKDTYDAEAYLVEARTVANLDHPHIVPVYDVGSTYDCPCYVVSKLIEGSTLTRRIRENRPLVAESVELVATLAETLHFAHRKGVVHRDVKPGNILLDAGGMPFVSDFGLALREEHIGRGPTFAGTPSYMSPEQARGEGHRVDGRSDIFSLGVVFYELLTGRRPFRGETMVEVLEQIVGSEARPPRQIDDQIPKELERICLKAMSKRAAERYTTGKDMADELRQFLAQGTVSESRPLRASPAPNASSTATPSVPPVSNQSPVMIVPKGLRSFDAHDADFFLELLPGPRDRDGLPESIRYWKQRIEDSDADRSFPVGLIYGPSGCGKSSLVKAGLLPRLAAHVEAIYVEATANDTELRLLSSLRKRFPLLDAQLSLPDALAALRRRDGLRAGKKVIIVLDQFEQWLHGRREDMHAQLVQALRHCDGGAVQCLLMVRDDFWLAVSRFLRELEVDLVPDRNVALVDLFDEDHAHKILAALGRAFGKLPEKTAEQTAEQKAFLTKAVTGLMQEGKVHCVRLALFAEMMKARPWTVVALKDVGGAEGLGVAYLEDTFASATANPGYRARQAAIRAVLQVLLPEAGSDIKGNMKSEDELKAVAGLAKPDAEFAELIHILDHDARLITPTDPAGTSPPGGIAALAQGGQRYYQLTHDYMVHSLRAWLTHKQRETRGGRAELRLADRAAVWTARPERRNLPSLSEWVKIQSLSRRGLWSAAQRRMMRSASRYHLTRLALVVAVLGFVVWGVQTYRGQVQAQAWHDSLKTARVSEVPALLKQMQPQTARVAPLVKESFDRETDPEKKLVLGLVLLQSDPAVVPYLYERLLQSAPQDFAVIRQILAPHKEEILPELTAEFGNRERDNSRRFRAACALVEYAPNAEKWPAYASFVVDGLIAQNPLALNYWKDALLPVRARLLPALAESLEDSKWGNVERRAIVEFYRDFAAGSADAYQPLEARLALEHAELSEPERAKRKAAIGAALVALGKGEHVWRHLAHSSNPTYRNYLIERLGTSGVDANVLAEQLRAEPDVSIRRALILAIASAGVANSASLSESLLKLYERDPDPGIHAACRWCLRKWKRGDQIAELDVLFALDRSVGQRRWFVNSQKQTFCMIEGPSQLLTKGRDMSPSTFRFAIGATEVTIGQFLEFRKSHSVEKKISIDANAPVVNVTWYHAVEYCNWLSKQEGIQQAEWCYEPNAAGVLDLAPNYQQRTGYRLPTELEWEFACRAGAQTQWYFGESDSELVGLYGWWLGKVNLDGLSRPSSVGELKPNDWGLFDTSGNVSEWCQESATSPTKFFGNDVDTIHRGGSYFSTYNGLRCVERTTIGRKLHSPDRGFRLVRTLR